MGNMINKIIWTVGILALFSTLYANDSLYSQAQKLYSQGSFEAAAKNYAEACPQMAAKEKKACQFNEVKALIESNKIDLANAAAAKLLALISQTEPGDSLFAELNAKDAKLQIMFGDSIRAVRSWNAAQASANTDHLPELFVLCQDIVSAFPGNGLTAESCKKIEPADTSLISLPRKKTVPLVASLVPQTQTQAPQVQQAPQAPVLQTPVSNSQTQWYVQLGAFGNKENAEKLVANFKNKGVQLYIVELTNKKFFAVRTGFFASAAEASAYAEQKIAPTHSEYKVFR